MYTGCVSSVIHMALNGWFAVITGDTHGIERPKLYILLKNVVKFLCLLKLVIQLHYIGIITVSNCSSAYVMDGTSVIEKYDL